MHKGISERYDLAIPRAGDLKNMPYDNLSGDHRYVQIAVTFGLKQSHAPNCLRSFEDITPGASLVAAEHPQ